MEIEIPSLKTLLPSPGRHRINDQWINVHACTLPMGNCHLALWLVGTTNVSFELMNVDRGELVCGVRCFDVLLFLDGYSHGLPPMEIME